VRDGGAQRAGTRLRWLGHSTVVLDVDGTRIVTDPVLRRRVLHLRRDAEVAPPADVAAILVSHLHYDHLDLPSLARIGVGTPIVIPRGGKRVVRGFESVTEVEPGVVLGVAGLRIRVVEALHEGRRRNFGTPIAAVGYVLEGSHRIYFAGDTDLFDGMRELAPLDLALLPVWGWGPKVGAGHLDPDRAAAALPMLRPRIAVPIHWGTYRVVGSAPAGSEPAQAFAAAALHTAPDVDVRVLPLGGALEL
jgi:L-ascorbate metabolism protein UlaG (beta-lactamase superfamily)